MKRRKILFLFPLAALILSGCSVEEVMDKAKSFLSEKIVAPVKNFMDLDGNGKKEEPKKEEKEDKEDEGQGQGEGEGGGQQQQEKQLVSISVSGEFKQEYEVGEPFDPTGIVITAAYDDQSSEDVTAEASFSGFDSTEPGEIKVTVSFGGQSAEIELTILTPIRSLSFPEAVAFYEEEGIEGVQIPNYVTPTGTLGVDDASGAYLIYDSSHEEMEDYAELLEEAGWTLEQDGYGDYNGVFGETRAQLYLADYIDYSYAAIVLLFGAAQAPSSSIPFELIQSIFAASGEVYYPIPDFEAANAEFLATEYAAGGWYYDSVLIQVSGATDEEIENYYNVALPAAGWSYAGGIATKAFPDLGGVATIAFGTFDDGSFAILMYYGFTPIPQAGFPSEAIAAAFEQLGVTPFEIPAPDGEGYTYEYEFDDSNLDYVDYPSYCYDTMYINNMNEDQLDAYALKIQEAGWADSVSNGKHTFTKQFGTKVAKFTCQHYYSDAYGDYVSLRIYYVMDNAPAWPADKAAQLVEKFAPGSSTVIPECPGGTKYSAYIGNSYNEIDVEGPESLKDEYAGILRAAGWTETEDGSYVFISPAQDIQIILAYTSYGLEIRVSGYIAPAAEWPAEDVAALLPSTFVDSVPAFEGADSYQLYNDNYGMGVTCFVGEGNEETAMAAYAETLVTAKFTLNNGFYHSEHDEFKIELWKGTGGAFNIELSIVPHWPTADAATLLQTLVPGLTDSLPAFEGAAGYATASSSTKVRVTVTFSTSSEASEAQGTYIGLLTGAGFSYAGDDEYGDPYYNSPHNEFNVNPWVSSKNLYIDCYKGTFTPPVEGWPAEGIKAALAALGYTDVLPPYESDEVFSYEASDEAELRISVYYGSGVASQVTAYESVLAEASFTNIGANSYGDNQFMSPNNQYKVVVWYSNGYLVIDINPYY